MQLPPRVAIKDMVGRPAPKDMLRPILASLGKARTKTNQADNILRPIMATPGKARTKPNHYERVATHQAEDIMT